MSELGKVTIGLGQATVYVFQTTACKANWKADILTVGLKRHSLELAPPCIALEVSSLTYYTNRNSFLLFMELFPFSFL